jgi:hypothetical protein
MVELAVVAQNVRVRIGGGLATSSSAWGKRAARQALACSSLPARTTYAVAPTLS